MEIKKSNLIENHHIFALIVGASGVGKTTLATTLQPEETIILSAESGLLSIKDKPAIDYIEIKSTKDIMDSINFLKSNSKYKNIVIDSLTEFGEIIFAELKPNFTKAQAFGLYDAYSEKMIGLIKILRTLRQYDIFMLALDKMSAKDFTEVVSIDLIQKSLSKKIIAYFDLVLYMQIHERENGDRIRALSTNNDVIDFAKDRSGKLDRYEKPNLQNIIDKILLKS